MSTLTQRISRWRLRYDAVQRSYEHVYGASAVRRVDSYEPAALENVRLIRELAAAPSPQRPIVARAALGHKRVDLEVRNAARRVLREAVLAHADRADHEKTLQLLRRHWREATMRQGFDSVRTGFEDLRDLDATLLAIDPEFGPASDERLDRWMAIIFAPFDMEGLGNVRMSQYMVDRWSAHMVQLSSLGMVAPEKISSRIVSEISQSAWPMQFRLGLANALRHMYMHADEAHEEWNAVLQRFYPDAFANADPWVLRPLASAMRTPDGPQYQTKRRFVAGEATWKALEDAHTRMHAAANGNPRVPEAFSAEIRLREALQGRRR